LLDIFVCNTGANLLYRGNGGSPWTFTNVASAAGVAHTGTGRGVAFFDYDGDGWLDLYVVNNGANNLYHNSGDGTFTIVTGVATDANVGQGVTVGDHDNDGWLVGDDMCE
jgi:hypothetical protein